MDKYQYTFNLGQTLPQGSVVKVGVAGSGNLEVKIEPNTKDNTTQVMVHTTVTGFKDTWDAVIERFVEDYPYQGLIISLYDAGATPPVVALRLRQAIETYQSGYIAKQAYTEANARSRIYSLVDEGSFSEFLLDKDTPSPTLPDLQMQVETDDGVVIGRAQFKGVDVAIAASQKDFIGGSVGEVHGAKINGLIQYAKRHQLAAIVLLIDSGGVRLQEANVGEIEISEIIRALLEARSLGIRTIGVICGSNGAYGGMGIISGALDYLIVNQGTRIGVSGAEVIQAVLGKEAFDATDRPLVWRVYGGRTRYLQGAVGAYTSHLTADIRQAILDALDAMKDKPALCLETVEATHSQLKRRLEEMGSCQEMGQWLLLHHKEEQEGALFNLSDKAFLDVADKMGTTS